MPIICMFVIFTNFIIIPMQLGDSTSVMAVLLLKLQNVDVMFGIVACARYCFSIDNISQL